MDALAPMGYAPADLATLEAVYQRFGPLTADNPLYRAAIEQGLISSAVVSTPTAWTQDMIAGEPTLLLYDLATGAHALPNEGARHPVLYTISVQSCDEVSA